MVSDKGNYMQLQGSKVDLNLHSAFHPISNKVKKICYKKNSLSVPVKQSFFFFFLLTVFTFIYLQERESSKEFYFGEIICFIKYHLHWIFTQSFIRWNLAAEYYVWQTSFTPSVICSKSESISVLLFVQDWIQLEHK